MECPHIESNLKINLDFLKLKRNRLLEERIIGPVNDVPTTVKNSSSSSLTSGDGAALLQPNKIWKCSDCDSAKENWICLHCGNCGCGRYDNGHALQHFQSKCHKICINSLNQSVYCYKCDDFIINETQKIEEIRTILKLDDTDSCSETSSTTTGNSTTEDSGLSASPRNKKSNNFQETASISSNDSGWGEETLVGRSLRPRKRPNSSDNSLGNNRKKTPKKQQTSKPYKVIGLRNLGNTCFMNSVLQSLSNIQEFSYYFNQLPSLETSSTPQKKQRVYHSRSLKENCSETDANVVEELRKVLINLSKGGDGQHKAISPECLFGVIWKVVPQFRGHRQHDAHEFLRYMLDRLHTELQHMDASGSCLEKSTAITGKINSILDYSGNYINKGVKSSIVTNVFGGTLQSEVKCLICGMESRKLDPFLDLSLDIPEKFFKNQDNEADGGKKSSSICNITDCLASFTEVEELTETELYYCNSCKCKQKSTKRFWIRRLPNVLCLHIKRFRWNNYYRTKIDMKIKFPLFCLDMSQYVLNNGPETRRNNQTNNVYDLAAVIVHHGNGLSCGHYTSYAINEGIWLHFNDHQVNQVPPSTVADCKPYILFYIRRDASITSPSALPSSSNMGINLNKTL